MTWRCGSCPSTAPLKRACPVHDFERPCVVAECICGSKLLCDYCGRVAYKYDPFGGRPICLDCFDHVVSC